MTNHEKIENLLTNQPLYRSVEVEIDFLNEPSDLADLTFSFYCPTEKSPQTFQLELEPTKFINGLGGNLLPNQFHAHFDSFDQETNRYNYTQHYSATCQHCKKYRIEFLLQVNTNKSIPRSRVPDDKYVAPVQIIKKIGQFPAYEIKPDNDLLNFLILEDKENYKKAIICLSQNYGIAAFAYLRRIVENELIRIVEDLSKIERPESSEIEKLIQDFKKSHVMSNLIDGIYNYLPSSLKNLGGNPIKLLYSQLSGGIHEFSENECFEKAQKIDALLKFVIKKISEENSEVRIARDIMKALK